MGVQIARKEGVLALYKGLGAVVTGIVPKMAIRFSSFEYYKGLFADKQTGNVSAGGNFMGKFVVEFAASSKTGDLIICHFESWSCCWYDRGSVGCNPYGRYQDPSASSASLNDRSIGYSQIP